MPSLKGSAWLFNLNFIKERFGNEGFEKVLGKMTPEEQAPLRAPILDAVWGPDFMLYMRFILLADELLGRGDKALIHEVAALQFRRDTKLYSVFFKFMTPELVLRTVPLVWQIYFKPAGRTDFKMVGEKHGEYRVFDFNPMPRHHEHFHSSYLEQILIHCGYKQYRVSHPQCLGRGNSECLWDFSWT